MPLIFRCCEINKCALIINKSEQKKSERARAERMFAIVLRSIKFCCVRAHSANESLCALHTLEMFGSILALKCKQCGFILIPFFAPACIYDFFPPFFRFLTWPFRDTNRTTWLRRLGFNCLIIFYVVLQTNNVNIRMHARIHPWFKEISLFSINKTRILLAWFLLYAFEYTNQTSKYISNKILHWFDLPASPGYFKSQWIFSGKSQKNWYVINCLMSLLAECG